MAIPSFSNSPWIRGAPQRQFSAAKRRIRPRRGESIHGLPGCRERRRQHRRNPSRCQRSTVAGWTSTSASLHRGHNHGKNSQSADSNERVRSTGGEGLDSRAGGLDASTRLIGPRRPSGSRLASAVECRAATPTSMILPGRDIGEAQVAQYRSVPNRERKGARR